MGELLGVDLPYSDDIFIILDWNLNYGFISISTSTELTKAHPTCLSSVQMMLLDELFTCVVICFSPPGLLCGLDYHCMGLRETGGFILGMYIN